MTHVYFSHLSRFGIWVLPRSLNNTATQTIGSIVDTMDELERVADNVLQSLGALDSWMRDHKDSDSEAMEQDRYRMLVSHISIQ